MGGWGDAIGQDPNRDRIFRLLEAAEAQGCAIQIPDGERDNYVNIRPPARSRRRGRIASVHVRSGSVEFQDRSWTRLGAPAAFRRLEAGDKAARTLDTEGDLEAVLDALRREIDPEP